MQWIYVAVRQGSSALPLMVGNKFYVFTLRWDIMVCKILQTPAALVFVNQTIYLEFELCLINQFSVEGYTSIHCCTGCAFRNTRKRGLLDFCFHLGVWREECRGARGVSLFSQGKRSWKGLTFHLAGLAHSQVLSLFETNEHAFPLVDFLFFIRGKMYMFIKN